jgi:hypothetical protein
MGVALIPGGMVMPWCTDQQVGLSFALMFMVGAPLSAVIAAWQLRSEENGHATN